MRRAYCLSADPRLRHRLPAVAFQGMFFYMLTLGQTPGRGLAVSGSDNPRRYILPAISQVVGGVALALTLTPMMPMLESAVRPLGEGAVVMARRCCGSLPRPLSLGGCSVLCLVAASRVARAQRRCGRLVLGGVICQGAASCEA